MIQQSHQLTNHVILSIVEEVSTLDYTLTLFRQPMGKLVQEAAPSHLFLLADLCQFCVDQRITHLWIMPGTNFAVVPGEAEILPECWDTLQHYLYPNEPHDLSDGVLEDNPLVSLHGYKKLDRGRSPRFNIIFTEHCSWDFVGLAASPEQLLTTIDALQAKLGVPIGASPSGVGAKYLAECTNRAWLMRPEIDLAAIPWNEAARPLIWQRRPTDEELNCKYLYCADKNSAHLRTAVEEPMGIGTPIHEDREFDHKIPGIWLCSYAYLDGAGYDARLPLPRFGNPCWLATPMVKLLQKSCLVTIHDAWIFPRYEHVLRKWGRNLWDMRQSYSPGTLERSAFKQIANDFMGLLRSELVKGTWKFRPDMNAQIVAGTYALMMYNIVRYAQDGHYPVMVQLDALYYVSDEETLGEAVPGILDHWTSLGGYKLKWMLPMEEKCEEGFTVRQILATAMNQSKKLQMLNKIAERLGY